MSGYWAELTPEQRSAVMQYKTLGANLSRQLSEGALLSNLIDLKMRADQAWQVCADLGVSRRFRSR